jgi:hypothetical protein
MLYSCPCRAGGLALLLGVKPRHSVRQRRDKEMAGMERQGVSAGTK